MCEMRLLYEELATEEEAAGGCRAKNKKPHSDVGRDIPMSGPF